MSENAVIPTAPTPPAIPQELAQKYERLLQNTGRLFAKPLETGIEVGQTTYPHLVGTSQPGWQTYFYRWANMQKEIFDESTSEEEVIRLQLKRGASFNLRPQGSNDLIAFDLPISSFVPFSSYAGFLRGKGLILETVLTRIGTAVKAFKMGTVPVFTFEFAGLMSQVVDASFVEKPAPQSHTVPATPAGWA